MKYDVSVSMHVMAALMDLEPSSYLSQKMNEYRSSGEMRMFGVEHCVRLLCNEMQVGVEAKS
jgi:hypothetical protein